MLKKEWACNLKHYRFAVYRLCTKQILYFIEYMHTFYIENGAEIFPANYTWKVAEKGFKIAFMMNKLQ